MFQLRYLDTYSANGFQLLANKKLSTNCLSVSFEFTFCQLAICHCLIISAASDIAISALANLACSCFTLSLPT
jgi:hypothetical protein